MTDITVNDLTPVLAVNDLEQSIAYYTQVLGFHLDWVWPEADPADHAGLSFGKGTKIPAIGGKTVRIHLSTTDQEISPSGWLFINVSNIDHLFTLHKERGAMITIELDDFPWGYREFEVTDTCGNRIRFTQELPHNQSTEDTVS